MGKQWKTSVGFAVLGFAITAGFYVLGVCKDYTKPFGLLDAVFGLANLILCPPVLLFAWCIDCEYGTPAGFEVNLVIVGLLNALLYAVIGLAVASQRNRNNSKR